MWEEEGEVKFRIFMKYIDKRVMFNFEKRNMNEGPFPRSPTQKNKSSYKTWAFFGNLKSMILDDLQGHFVGFNSFLLSILSAKEYSKTNILINKAYKIRIFFKSNQ